MMQRFGRVATPLAATHMRRLCQHFSRKIPVRFDAREGLAEFPWGQCRFLAAEEDLRLCCLAEDAERLARVCRILEQHIELLSRKSPLRLCWDEAGREQG